MAQKELPLSKKDRLLHMKSLLLKKEDLALEQAENELAIQKAAKDFRRLYGLPQNEVIDVEKELKSIK